MKTILSVDNDCNDQELFKRTLEGLTYEKCSLVQIFTVQELLAQIECRTFDFIFMDYSMFRSANMLMDIIKRLANKSNVIVMSHADSEFVQKMLFGFDNVIYKGGLAQGLQKYLRS